jgi:hypothetical protein
MTTTGYQCFSPYEDSAPLRMGCGQPNSNRTATGRGSALTLARPDGALVTMLVIILVRLGGHPHTKAYEIGGRAARPRTRRWLTPWRASPVKVS